MIDAGLSQLTLANPGHLPVLRQAAALCYRLDRGRPEVLLITTRKSRRWIIPKGWLIDGLTPSQTARQEAWEEAGVRGECTGQAIGCFSYFKHRPKRGSVLCAVDVYPILTRSTASKFPECDQRQRKWLPPKKAAARVNSPELALLLRKVGPFPH